MANYSPLKLIFLKIFILSVLQPYFSANALRCYICRPDGSESDPELRDVFTAVNQQREASGQIRACSAYEDEEEIPLQTCRSETTDTRCVKFAKLRAGRRDEYVEEEEFSARSCLNIAKPYTSFVATEGYARHEIYNQITMHYCDEDECNSAAGLSIKTLLMTGSIFLLFGPNYLL